MTTTDGDAEVVRLPNEPPPVAPPSAPGRVHGLAIAGMGISALVGVGALFTFVTVTMPDSVSRLVIGIFLGAGAVFLVCATSAVFAAARDTYRDSSSKTDDA